MDREVPLGELSLRGLQVLCVNFAVAMLAFLGIVLWIAPDEVQLAVPGSARTWLGIVLACTLIAGLASVALTLRQRRRLLTDPPPDRQDLLRAIQQQTVVALAASEAAAVLGIIVYAFLSQGPDGPLGALSLLALSPLALFFAMLAWVFPTEGRSRPLLAAMAAAHARAPAAEAADDDEDEDPESHGSGSRPGHG